VVGRRQPVDQDSGGHDRIGLRDDLDPERRGLHGRHHLGAGDRGAAGDDGTCPAHEGIGREAVDVHAHAALAGDGRVEGLDRPRDRAAGRRPAPGVDDARARWKREGELRAEQRVGAAIAEAQRVLEIVAHPHRVRVGREHERERRRALYRRAERGAGRARRTRSSIRAVVERIVPAGILPRTWIASCTLRLVLAASVSSAQTTSRSPAQPSGIDPPSDGTPQAKTRRESVRRSSVCTASSVPWLVAVSR